MNFKNEVRMKNKSFPTDARSVVGATMPFLLCLGMLIVAISDALRGRSGSANLPISSIHAISLFVAWHFFKSLQHKVQGFFVSIWASLGVVYIVADAMGTSGFCRGCNSLGWINILAIVIGGLSSIAFVFQGKGDSWLSRSLLLICISVPVLQLGLLTAIPKTCFGCIATGCAAIGVVVYWLEKITTEPPRKNIGKFLLMAPPIVITALSMIGSRVDRPASPEILPNQVVGKTIRAIGLEAKIHEDGLYVMSLPGCGWCEKLRQYLSSKNIKYKDISMSDQVFSSITLDRTVAPQVIQIRSGIVTRHIIGYDSVAIDQL